MFRRDPGTRAREGTCPHKQTPGSPPARECACLAYHDPAMGMAKGTAYPSAPLSITETLQSRSSVKATAWVLSFYFELAVGVLTLLEVPGSSKHGAKSYDDFCL